MAGGCVLALMIGGFYLLQRRGLFGRMTRLLQRISGSRDWSGILKHAEAIDVAARAYDEQIGTFSTDGGVTFAPNTRLSSGLSDFAMSSTFRWCARQGDRRLQL